MIRRLLSSALIIAGTIAVAPSAFAESVDIPFTGTVGGACTFGSPTGGTLKAGNVSTPSISPTAILSEVRGKVTVSCNSSANVVASNPVQTGGPTFTPVANSTGVNLSIAGGNSYYGANVPMPLPNGTSPLEVSMYVDKGSAIAPGTYNYKVTLTITP